MTGETYEEEEQRRYVPHSYNVCHTRNATGRDLRGELEAVHEAENRAEHKDKHNKGGPYAQKPLFRALPPTRGVDLGGCLDRNAERRLALQAKQDIVARKGEQGHKTHRQGRRHRKKPL